MTTRPLASGDSFTYTGSITTTLLIAGSSPAPMATTVASVSQTVTLSGPTTQNGVSNLTDVHVAETDTTPLQTSTSTTDLYEMLASTSTGQNLVEVSSNASTSTGYVTSVSYPSPFVLDVLPENSGANFTNSPAQTIAEQEPGGYSSSRMYASDGTYTDRETYPASTSPGGSATPFASVVEYHDGHGIYMLPLQGYSTDSTISVGSPAPSNTIPLTLQVPDPTVSPMTVSVPVWYAQPLNLYRETNLQTGLKSLPASCGVPTSIATAANALVGQIERVDTVLGVDETTNQVSYVAPMYGLVCLQLNDVAKSYYDYNGESLDGVAITGTASPLEIAEVQATFGLSAAPTLQASARNGSTDAVAVRTAALRASFDRLVARAQGDRRRRALGLAPRASAR